MPKPEYDSPEMDKLVAAKNKELSLDFGRHMNPTEEHLFRQWESGLKFSTVGD